MREEDAETKRNGLRKSASVEEILKEGRDFEFD